MMSKFSLKKYTVALLVCFLSFLGIANAEDITLTLGDVYPIAKGFKENFVCKFEDGSTNGSSGNPFKLEKKTTDDSWAVTYTTVQSIEVRKNVVCTYNDPEDDNKEKRDTYTFITDLLYSNNYTVILEEDNNFVGDIGKKINLGQIVEVGQLKSAGVLPDSNKYFSLSCSGTSCKATLNDDGKAMVNRGAGFKAEVKIKFKKKNSDIPEYANVTLSVNIKQTTKAYPGDVGTCRFDSEWSSEKSESKNSGQIYRYHSTESDYALLPDCKAKSDLPAVFKGWVTGYSTGDHITAIGNCKNALPKNSTVEPGASYAACYELSANIVQLGFGAGRLTDADEAKWTAHKHAAYEELLKQQGLSTSFATGYYYMTTDATETITLPSELILDGYNEGRVLIEWVHQKTGKTVAPGASVPVAGSNVYIANISGVNYATKDRNKTIYVGESNILSDSAAGYGKLCKSADPGKVEASFKDGKCTISGKAKTDSPVDVTLVTDDGDIVFKVTVLESYGQNQGGNSEFVIDTTPNIIIGENDDGNDLVSGSMCTEFRISLNSSVQIGTIAGTQSKLLSSLYKVTPLGDCDTDSKYVALCLDPGLLGPSGHLYKLEQTLASNHPLNKLAQEIVDRNERIHGKINMDVFGELNSNERVSAHVASRIVAMKERVGAGTDQANIKYVTAHNAYKNVANAITSYTESKVKNALNDYFSISMSGVVDGVVDLLTKFEAQSPEVSNFDKVKVDFDHKDAEPNGSNGYKIVYTGTITLPEGIEATGLEACDPNATLGIKCGENPEFEQTGQIGSGADTQYVYSYRVEMIVDDATKVKLPSTKSEEQSISFKMKVSENAFVKNVGVATPTSGDKMQQMLVFDLGEPDLYVYFPPVLDRICTIGLEAVNPDKCQSADQCGEPFNRQLFKQAGCCEELTDEGSASYIVESVCNGVCTSSTFVEVCEYNAETVGNADLYEINEGTYKNFEEGTEQQDYHQCVVNVTDKYDSSVVRQGMSNSANKNSFTREDDVGQIRNVDIYETNTYCQVTCKEDWQISMDAFGNYVGINAVAAGSYFQIVNNDVFMSGQRTCYTSFLDYDQYMKDLIKLSEQLVDEYNIYSEASHIYTSLSNMSVGSVSTSNLHNPSCDNSCEEDGDCGCCCSGPLCSCSGSCKTDYSATETRYYAYLTFDIDDSGRSDGDNDGTGNFEFKGYKLDPDSTGTDTDLKYDEVSYGDISFDVGYTNSGTCGCGDSSGCETSEAKTASYSFKSPKLRSVSIDLNTETIGLAEKTTIDNPVEALENAKSYFEPTKNYFMEELQKVITEALANMETYKSEIEQRSQDMFDCQHFIQYNLSDDSESRNGKVKIDAYNGKLFGEDRGAIQIDTAFEPKAAYTYDEKAFMTILGKDNVLEMYDYKNHTLYGGTFESFKSSSAYDDATEKLEKITLTNYDGSGSSKEVELTRNAMETVYYNPTDIWAPDSDESRKYEDGTKKVVDAEGNGSYSTYGNSDFEEKTISFCTVTKSMNGQQYNNDKKIEDIGTGDTWAAGTGGCYEYKIKYVKAHYIKNSIKNSSFYKNKGYWFNRGSDVKEHGDTLAGALSNANNANNRDVNYSTDQAELDRWSLLGTYNVFPVSMTTPRNLYQYTYTFGDIGSYSDGDLGRIMGKDKSIISLNHRTCFYEVYEEICLCCGDTINVHVDNDDSDKTEPFLNSTPAYNFNKSDSDKIASNTDGSISFATSSVALGDVYKDTEVADNWNNTAPFTYNGNNHLATDKGAKLLEEIQALGEEIYNEEPEYSFYLDTSTLAAIREYNDNYGYDVNYNNLKVYGRYSIVPIEACASNPTGCKWSTDDETMNNTIINFQHYGSTFLEEVLPSLGSNVVLGKTLSKNTSDDNVCVVSSSQVGNHSQILTRMAVGTGASSGCRWIDYIEDIEAVKSNASTNVVVKKDPATGRVERYYRMAFK